VIDNVELSETTNGRGALRVTVALSTFFRNAAQ